MPHTEAMTTMNATWASQNFAAVLDAAGHEPVRIQRDEQDVAFVLSPQEYFWLKEGRWSEFDHLATEASAEAGRNGLTEELLAEILAE
jgi:PHD/YefM family antitoxin component YafN of YafNO toxin-antitoxin module